MIGDGILSLFGGFWLSGPLAVGTTRAAALALSLDGTIGGFSGGSELQVAFAVYRGESGRFGRLCEGKTGAPEG